MFRTTQVPEQMSPHEWRTLDIPFSEDGEAYFHACRSARWFAPFFARTFRVPAYGYHLYTTFSRRPDRFLWDAPLASPDTPLYVVALPGKKSHGVGASLLKYAHVLPVEKLRRFEPDDTVHDNIGVEREARHCIGASPNFDTWEFRCNRARCIGVANRYHRGAIATGLFDDHFWLAACGPDSAEFETVSFGFDDLERLRADRASGTGESDTGQ
jgi:hypothetical protein